MNPNQRKSSKFKQVFVLSTAMLSFISFWRAASIVLCDFGSSAYYAGGIAMKSFGAAFPWFILAVMLFAGAMLAVYVESCGMFVRGGVYVVVRRAIGKVMAKMAVSALMFDFVVTGPISATSAGLYLGYLASNLFHISGADFNFPIKIFAMFFGVAVISYFWRKNIKGVGESSDTNVKIVSFVAVIAAVLFAWSLYTLWIRGFKLPPFEIHFTEEALGWAKYIDWMRPIGLLGIFMAFGHSILALSGLETMAQVYREIEDPKIKNLKKTALIVFAASFMFTGVLTFISSLIIPYEQIATRYADNLLSGLAMELHGPYAARFMLQILVVVSGGLILIGAVNTSMVGANGMLNRVAEDGILHDWFRQIHKKYGTTHRMINVIAVAQISIVLISRGDIYLLGEAYAFGVLWSLVFDTLSLIVLRFKDPGYERGWLFPLNIKIKNIYVPLGLSLVFLVLLVTAVINLVTKNVATVSGVIFSGVFFMIFQISEKLNSKKTRLYEDEPEIDEKLNLSRENDILELLPKLKKERRILVPVRNPNNLVHLKHVLAAVDDETADIIVMSAKISKIMEFGREESPIGEGDKDLFKDIILLAEKYGKTIIPLLLFSNDPFYSIMQAAASLKVDEVILGVSGTMGAEAQLERLAMTWGLLKSQGFETRPVKVKIIWQGRKLSYELN